MPWAHQAGFSRRSLAGVGFFESVRCHGTGLALLTNGGVQQQETQLHYFGYVMHIFGNLAHNFEESPG
ncbi:hypothetical protein TNCV_4879241 [Trichonephila clavipes]|nr:hypothetical protein TNCV_4879241 [Trichonephila clavipes]